LRWRILKIILSGGGTGGHIYPALTIADQLKKLQPNAEIIFVGTKQGLEKNIIPRYGYILKFIDVAGFNRSFGFETFRSAGKLFIGIYDARHILSEVKPDLVIGTGGYVCAPVVFMAALKNIPTCIQEQNAFPGVTNKILSRYVKKVFLGYQEAARYLPAKTAVEYIGNPVREEILAKKKEIAIAELGLDPGKKTILVSGGSRGAKSINRAMLDVEMVLSGRHDVQVLHITGDVHYEKYIKEIGKRSHLAANIIIQPYLHNMPDALAVADLAIFRSGAIGLAELTARGIPSVLVPYPYATDNHQEFNARAIEAKGAAKVILDRDLNGSRILEIVEHLLLHNDELQKMQKAAKDLGRPRAAEIIARHALELVTK